MTTASDLLRELDALFAKAQPKHPVMSLPITDADLEFYDAMITHWPALRDLLRSREWQPTETAPKHVRLLAVVEDSVRIVMWGKTSHVPLYGWCVADQGVEDFDLCKPKCWMPLPLPPSPDARQE